MRKSTRAHLAGQHESLDSGQTVYWEAQTQDAFGNIIDEDYGNNTTTVRGFDGVTGRIDYIDTKNGALQDLTYTWDKVGNLLSRKDWRQSGNPTENFVYDTLNRMTDADISGAATLNLNVTYDENGNIEKKDDVTSSTWGYHANNKHAVTSAGWNSYSYDANGNMTSRKGDTITWTSYNYPSEIDDGPRTYQYSYDAGRQKWKQVYDDGSSSETTYFAGRLFEKNVNSSDTDHRHYIMANGRAVAVFVERSSQYNYVRYLTHDHLGSTDGIVTETGVMQVAESFSAFGERRDPIDWIGDPSAGDQILIANRMDRGYTDHINLEKSSLIHMNGRVYDAEIGRFLSPDPYVFQPMNTQGFNRYAYVQNNPMRYTDPSGFDLVSLGVTITFHSALSWLIGGDDPPPPDFCKDNSRGCGGPAPNQMAQMDAGHYPDLPGNSSQTDAGGAPYDPPIEPVYPLENAALFVYGGGVQAIRGLWHFGRGAYAGVRTAILLRATFTASERAIIREASAMLGSAEFAAIRAAHAAGQSITVNIGGRVVQYEAGLTFSQAMTLSEVNGFVIGPRAFSSSLETAKTVSQELFRLESGTLGYAQAGGYATEATAAAFEFAEQAGKFVLGTL